ncbi:MAG TPA: protein TolR [Acidisphaera sp.]|nr:protein TolR [Acidisphaera sp.]
MAASLRPTGRGGRYRPLAEINVTPLVDVMLVLLIIFMVTAPLMTSGVTVDLPKTNAQPLNTDAEPVTVSINAAGDIYIQDAKVDVSDLVAKLQNISQNNPDDRRIFVRGDKDLAYGRIMQVMGIITQGGFTKVALLAEQPSGATPATPSVPPPPAAPSAAPSAPAAPAGARPGGSAAPRAAR